MDRLANTNIELRHLRHFIALAEELHFGRAARRCNISQPPFSVSIRQLEKVLAMPLVERSTKEVRLTAAGRAYYEEALTVMQQLHRAGDAAARAAQGLGGTLHVGFFASMLYKGLDSAVKVFEAEHPDVELKLLELSTAEQIPALLRQRIQYGFVHSATLPAGIRSAELVREPFAVCLPAAHVLATAERVDLAQLAGEPFIIFSREFSSAYYDTVIALCVAAGFHPRIRYESRYWLTVLACVSREFGAAVVPSSLARAELTGISIRPIVDNSILSVVRGMWLQKDRDDPVVMAWHRAVVAATPAATVEHGAESAARPCWA